MSKGTIRSCFRCLWLSAVAVAALAATPAQAADRLLHGTKVPVPPVDGDNRVVRRGFEHETELHEHYRLPLDREHPWSLPKAALAADFLDTIHCLVLRFDFAYEAVDDPNTTGRGVMDLSRPLDTLTDEEYIARVGHIIDPPPHDSGYFASHLRALANYYEVVSDGKITLSWNVFPPAPDSTYNLGKPMSHYGRCDFNEVIEGLEAYFVDGIRLADTVSPDIIWSNYDAIFMFHAGSDRQSDIGFPTTCSDLFTGWIRFGSDSVTVDNGTVSIRTALTMPETTVQDNRISALNAVMAHEFGHQLGLVDLYSTATFMTQIGDFALMDNNGFGTGIDFDFPAGTVFGTIPVYPTAWDRAYLGFVDVVDFRQGSDVRLVAAQVVSDGIKVARVPITENEYYLIENRIIDADGLQAFARADSATGVILGPADSTRTLTREYDFLLPGSGVLIYHIDESVAGKDWDRDSLNNFEDNDLQWYRDIDGNVVDRFMSLVEADGITNFGGFYRSGFGKAEDMFREDRNSNFTPNTNPPAIDNTGNNTHVRITNIRRGIDNSFIIPKIMDSVVLFDVETESMADGWPVRAGQPRLGLSPISADINGDGSPEIIVASGNLLSVVNADGSNFLFSELACNPCDTFFDVSIASVHPGRLEPVPLYRRIDPADGDTSIGITAGPVAGRFAGDPDTPLLLAIGYQRPGSPLGRVEFLQPTDGNGDAQADPLSAINVSGVPLVMSFGERFFVLTGNGYIYEKVSRAANALSIAFLSDTLYHGMVSLGSSVIVLSGDEDNSSLHFLSSSDSISLELDRAYSLGPILVDLDRDGSHPELVAATTDGDLVAVTISPVWLTSPFGTPQYARTGYSFTVNPVAGDVDLDGRPDIIIGGSNAVYAFGDNLVLKSNYPFAPGDRYPDDDVIAAPVIADIEAGGVPEIVFPTLVGNIYSFGEGLTYGFPLSAGEIGAGSPLVLTVGDEGRLGYLGADGWFYLWETAVDTVRNFWPMGGANASGTFQFNSAKLGLLSSAEARLPEERFYCYPNPVTEGATTIRYYLGEDASRVDLTVYDMTGREIAVLAGPTVGGLDNEVAMSCSGMSPGVYRCIIKAEFSGGSETAFTDVAVIR